MSWLDRFKGIFAAEREPSRALHHAEGQVGAALDALRAVMDPEIGRDVVALGMVRAISVVEGTAYVRFAPTTAGCPLEGWLVGACTHALQTIGLRAEVEIVTDPPWTPADMES